MKDYTHDQLADIGWGIIEARKKGGKTILKNYGKGYFSKLGKLSADKKKALKNGEANQG